MNYFACIPVSTPGYKPGLDYSLAQCGQCGCVVYLGPKQRAKANEDRCLAVIMCPKCIHKLSQTRRVVCDVIPMSKDSGSQMDWEEFKRVVG